MGFQPHADDGAHRNGSQSGSRTISGRQRRPGRVSGFGHERDGAAGARVDLDQENLAVFHRELHVHQADNTQRQGQGLGLAVEFFDDVFRQ